MGLKSKRGSKEFEMKTLIWLLVIILIIIHQDFWYWEDATLVFGFLPIGLAYHAGISIAAGIVWTLACQFAWPEGIDDFDNEAEGGAK
jgi:hypothetical protein